MKAPIGLKHTDDLEFKTMVSNQNQNLRFFQLNTFNPSISSDGFINKLAGFYGEDVSISYLPEFGDSPPALELKSANKAIDIDLYGETESQLEKEISGIIATLRKVRPNSIKLKGLNRHLSTDISYDTKAGNVLMSALHKSHT